MVLSQAKQDLAELAWELTDLRRLPLPAQDVQKAWLNGLYECLHSIHFVLSDVVGAASGIDSDEVKENDGVSDTEGGSGSPGAEGGDRGGLGAVTPLP